MMRLAVPATPARRGQERFVLAQCHHQRRAGARADHHVRLVLGHHGDRVGAVQALGDRAHRANRSPRVALLGYV
jgi:hypothetical protein